MSLVPEPAPTIVDINDAITAWKEVLSSPEHEYAWVTFTFDENFFAKTLDVHRSERGGITELFKKCAELTHGNKVCWGGYKVHELQSETGNVTSRFVGFEYVPVKAKINAKRVAKETGPHVRKAMAQVDCFIKTNNLDDLTDAETLRARLQLPNHESRLVFHHVVGVETATAAWKEVLNTPMEEFPWVLFQLSKSQAELVVHKSEGEGGMEDMMAKLRELTADGEACWGGFKVQSVDDASLLRKKPKKQKFVGFQLIAEGAKPRYLDVIPHAAAALNTENLDFFLEATDIEEVADTRTISAYLKLNDEWTLYEFGAGMRCRTDITVDIDMFGKQKLEVAQALDAWDLVLSNTDKETFCMFAMSPNRKKLEVVVHGGGAGLKSSQVAAKAMLHHNTPVWGCLRLPGKQASRRKFFGFQVIPEQTPPLLRGTVNLIKPILMRTLKQAVIWIEAETEDCISEEVIRGKLKTNKMEDPEDYDFGDDLPEEARAVIEKKVTDHFALITPVEVEEQSDAEETAAA